MVTKSPGEKTPSFQEVRREKDPWSLHQLTIQNIAATQEQELSSLSFHAIPPLPGEFTGKPDRAPQKPHVTFLSLIGVACFVGAGIALKSGAPTTAGVLAGVGGVAWLIDVATGHRF